jgi:serine/threonine-protein kinase
MVQKLLDYDVLEQLGEGARSTIYLVEDPGTKRRYALKHVVRDAQKDIRFVQQMETEFEISRQFTHPNLRRSYKLDIKKTMLLKVVEAFLVMELFNGRPLDAYLPPNLFDILDTFTQTAEGLRAMHAMNFVHCDLKPNNILRNDTGQVKVIDFGQSCRVGTVKERIQGTPDFIAPEQVAVGKQLPMTVQTDVFNFGATLYWALTGRHIPTLYTVNKQGGNSLLSDELMQAPIDLNPRVPEVVSKLVMECVATRPSKRPPDMDYLIQKLEIGKHLLRKAAGEGGPANAPIDPADSTVMPADGK